MADSASNRCDTIRHSQNVLLYSGVKFSAVGSLAASAVLVSTFHPNVNETLAYLTNLIIYLNVQIWRCGSADLFIAPPDGCRALFDQLGSSDKQYQECGLHSGFSEDYNHSRLVSSRSASREIWPIIRNWLAERYYCK